MFLANILGIIIGALPGLTATMGIALLTGLTYGLPREVALVVLMSLYIGAIYGGSITAILLNIPGTGSAAATALDGYPLALKGRAGPAIGMARLASFFGTLFGMFMLMAIAPQLAKIALLFTSAEYALLGLFGVINRQYPYAGLIFKILKDRFRKDLVLGYVNSDDPAVIRPFCQIPDAKSRDYHKDAYQYVNRPVHKGPHFLSNAFTEKSSKDVTASAFVHRPTPAGPGKCSSVPSRNLFPLRYPSNPLPR